MPYNVDSAALVVAETADFSGADVMLPNAKVLWSGAFYMHGTQSVPLSELVSEQMTGIIVVFSRYASGEAKNDSWSYHFVPKSHMTFAANQGVGFVVSRGAVSGSSLIYNKYLYIRDDSIDGNAENSVSPNNSGVLRYVLGV